jgi:hypothetical protein
MAVRALAPPVAGVSWLRWSTWLFVSPADAFRYIAAAPRWRAALAVLVAVTLGVAVVEISRLDLDEVAGRAVERQPNLSADEVAGTAAAVRGTLKAMVLMAPLVVALYHVAMSGALFAGLHLLGAGVPFVSVFATVVHAAVPPVLCKGLVTIILALQRDSLAIEDLKSLVASNVAIFLPQDAPRAWRIAGDALDIFTIWKWGLVVVGLSIASGASRRKVALLCVAVWGGWLALRLAIPWIQG